MTTTAQMLFENGSGLKQSKGGVLASRQLAINIAAMLLEASGRDGDYAPEELEVIKEALAKQLQIAPEQMNSILQEADALRDNRSNFETSARAIREALSADQLIVVLAMVWQVLGADGRMGTEERHFADGIRSRLALSAEHSKEAEKLASRANKRHLAK